MTVKAIVVALLSMAALPHCSLAGSSATAQSIQQHAHQAQELLREGKPDLAITELEAVVTLDPANESARSDLGTLLYFRGEYQKAAEQLSIAAKRQPTAWKTVMLLGMCEKRLGQSASARTHLEEAFPKLTEEKLRVQAGLELTEIYYAARDLDKAADVLAILRKLRPDDPGILYTAHRIYTEQADETTLGLAMLAPNSAWMHELVAEEMIKLGNNEAAIQHYRDAIKLDPNVPSLHFELAELLTNSQSASEKDQAEKEYEAALQQNPFDEKSECRLGRIALSRSDSKAAYAHYSRALNLQPEDPEANIGLGRVLLAMHEPQKAQPLFQKAVQLDPSDATAHYHLGTIDRQMGRDNEAKQEFAEFQRLKQLKEQLREVYKKMRLQKKPDADLPDIAQ